MNIPIDEHSCSYYCDRPECIKAQRDEMRERLKLLDAQEPKDSQPVPVEPLLLTLQRQMPTVVVPSIEPMRRAIEYIDTLQSELKRVTEERKSFDAELCKIESVVCMLPEFDGDKAGDCGDRLANAITRLKQSREAAESLNKRMAELLRAEANHNPFCSIGHLVEHGSIAELLKEVGE